MQKNVYLKNIDPQMLIDANEIDKVIMIVSATLEMLNNKYPNNDEGVQQKYLQEVQEYFTFFNKVFYKK